MQLPGPNLSVSLNNDKESTLKKFLTFYQKKAFLIFQENGTLIFQVMELSSPNSKKIHQENKFLYFRKWNFLAPKELNRNILNFLGPKILHKRFLYSLLIKLP